MEDSIALPPHPSNSGNFFQILKTTFCAYDRKNCDDVCNDNYDGKDGNFDNNGDKKLLELIQNAILGTITWEKGPKIRA